MHDISQDKSEKPRQPTGINFPSSSFGNKGVSRSFKESWYARYPWLEYSISLNSAFVFHVDSSLFLLIVSLLVMVIVIGNMH